MSTRSAIVEPDKDFATTGNFHGRYHHWDGYPSGLGRTLYRLFKVKKNRAAVRRFLLEDHPAGFGTINHFGLKPKFNKSGKCSTCLGYTQEAVSVAKEYQNKYIPKCECGTFDCFCHGEAHNDPEQIVTHKDAAGIGCEWVYVLDIPNAKIHVMSSVNDDGSKMIGMFGFGNSDAQWKVVYSIDMNGKEPDWDEVAYGYLPVQLWKHYRNLPECYKFETVKDNGYHSYCPNGHPFGKGDYVPGETCEGRYQHGKASGCDHVFKLPDNLLTGGGIEEVQVLENLQKALSK